jgi:hypothetical protein
MSKQRLIQLALAVIFALLLVAICVSRLVDGGLTPLMPHLQVP